MAIQNINAIHIQLHDTEANWSHDNYKEFVPLKGQIVIYDKDTAHPSERVKIGDGSSKVGDLPFLSNEIPGRKEDTTVGENSLAVGSENTAAGDSSFVSGKDNTVACLGFRFKEIEDADNYGFTGNKYYIAITKDQYDNLNTDELKNELENKNYCLVYTSGYISQGTIQGIGWEGTDDTGCAYFLSDGTDYYPPNKVNASNKLQNYSCMFFVEEMDVTVAGENKPVKQLKPLDIGVEHVCDYAHAEGYMSLASGYASHAEGQQTIAFGVRSHAEGWGSVALGNNNHVEGYLCVTNKSNSHAEGYMTKALGQNSHTEGGKSTAEDTAKNSHAEGYTTLVRSESSHSEGYTTQTGSHAFEFDVKNENNYDNNENKYYLTSVEGIAAELDNYNNKIKDSTTLTDREKENKRLYYTMILGGNYDYYGEIIGVDTLNMSITVDKYIKPLKYAVNKTHNYRLESGHSYLFLPNYPELGTKLIGTGSHSEGYETKARSIASHAEGYATIAEGKYSHAEGKETKSGYAGHAEGWHTEALGEAAHAENYGNKAKGNYSHAEGLRNEVTGGAAHVEGQNNEVSGGNAHGEGLNNKAIGINTHAEGYMVQAIGDNSHAEGRGGAVRGGQTLGVANGEASHIEGYNNITGDGATGAHAEGGWSEALGAKSHAEGTTVANKALQHTEGRYNKVDNLNFGAPDDTDARGAYIHIAGNGTASNKTSNAHTLDWHGNAWYAGDVYVSGTYAYELSDGIVKTDAKKLATKEDIDNLPKSVYNADAISPFVVNPKSDTPVFTFDFREGEDFKDGENVGLVIQAASFFATYKNANRTLLNNGTITLPLKIQTKSDGSTIDGAYRMLVYDVVYKKIEVDGKEKQVEDTDKGGFKLIHIGSLTRVRDNWNNNIDNFRLDTKNEYLSPNYLTLMVFNCQSGTNSNQVLKPENVSYKGWYRVIDTKGKITDVNNPSATQVITETTDVVKYVSTSGNDDTNDGNSKENPYGSIQKAIDSGATVVHIAPDEYREKVVAKNKTKLHLIGDVSESGSVEKKAKICNKETITVTGDCQVEGQSFFKIGGFGGEEYAFLHDAFSNEEQLTRSSIYNRDNNCKGYVVNLWANCREGDEAFLNSTNYPFRLIPFAWAEDHEPDGSDFLGHSWTYYNEAIYISDDISPTNISPEYYTLACNKNHKPIEVSVPDDQYDAEIYLSNIDDLVIENIDVSHGPVSGFSIINCNNCKITNCNSSFNGIRNGFYISNSTGTFSHCIANYNRNDGYGIVGSGTTDYFNCEGHCNGDDGISHHDACTGMIQGGKFTYNGKSGVAPAHGAVVNCYNAVCENNGVGFYCVSDTPQGRSYNLVNCIAKNNNPDGKSNYADIKVSNYHINLYNCTYDTTTKTESAGTSLNIICGKVESIVTLDTSAWTTSSGRYSQEVTVPGVHVGDHPIIDVEIDEKNDNIEDCLTAWENITRARCTVDNKITFYADKVKPTTTIKVIIHVC